MVWRALCPLQTCIKIFCIIFDMEAPWDDAPQVAWEEERAALGKIVHAILNYRKDAEREISRWQFNWAR